jgi:cation diffusion facilitator family transporter
MSAGADSLKSILFALGANFAIAVAKTAGAFFTGSTSLLAEAIHSYADCANQGLLIWGLKEGKRKPSPDHPLGHGKAIYFWSFIVALMLFSMGGLFSIYEGIHKLHDPEPVKYVWVAIAILVFGIAAESLSTWGCLREVNKERGDMSLWRWFRTSRQSELLVVLAEDLAALGGLTIALVFIVVAFVTGDPRWDAAGSIAIGALLVLVAVVVGVEVKALLIGQSVEASVLAKMRGHLERQSEVEHVYNLLTQQLGSDVMVAVKAKMRPAVTGLALVEAINRVEQSFRAAFPQVQWMFFEPDVRD